VTVIGREDDEEEEEEEEEGGGGGNSKTAWLWEERGVGMSVKWEVLMGLWGMLVVWDEVRELQTRRELKKLDRGRT
jgi:hypothetical protein